MTQARVPLTGSFDCANRLKRLVDVALIISLIPSSSLNSSHIPRWKAFIICAAILLSIFFSLSMGWLFYCINDVAPQCKEVFHFFIFIDNLLRRKSSDILEVSFKESEVISSVFKITFFWQRKLGPPNKLFDHLSHCYEYSYEFIYFWQTRIVTAKTGRKDRCVSVKDLVRSACHRETSHNLPHSNRLCKQT